MGADLPVAAYTQVRFTGTPSIDSDIPYLTADLVVPATEPEAIEAPELVGETDAVVTDAVVGEAIVADAVVAEPEAPAEPEALTPPEPAAIAEPEVVVADAIVPEPEAPAEPEAVVAEPEAVPVPEPVVATNAIAAEAIADSDAATAPEADLAAAAMVPAAAEPDSVVADEPAATEHEAGAALAPLAAAAVIESIVADEPEPALKPEDKAAAQTSGLLRRFRPGQNLDAELEAYERDHATEPITAATAASPESPAATPEPIVPELAAAAALAAPAPAPEAPAPAPAADDVVAQPVWQMVAPDPSADVPATPTPDSPSVPAAANGNNPGQAPQWPAGPQWPTTAGQANGLPFLGRPAAPQGGLDALWAESSREVVATPAVAGRVNGVVQPCVSCGLSLSANARFCRRCGTPQAG